MYIPETQHAVHRTSTGYILPLPTDRPPARLDDADADAEGALRTMERSLRVIEARIAALARQCDQVQRASEDATPTRQRDVLHLRARIQGLLQSARDVDVVLNRLNHSSMT